MRIEESQEEKEVYKRKHIQQQNHEGTGVTERDLVAESDFNG